MQPQSLRPLPNLWFSSAPLQSRSDILGSTLNGRQWVQPGGSKLFVRSALPLVQHTKPANSIQPAVPAKAPAHPNKGKPTKRKTQSTRTTQERPVTPKTAQVRGQLFFINTSHGALDTGVLLGNAPSAARASPAAGRKAAGGIVCSQVTLPTLRTVVPLHRG